MINSILYNRCADDRFSIRNNKKVLKFTKTDEKTSKKFKETCVHS